MAKLINQGYFPMPVEDLLEYMHDEDRYYIESTGDMYRVWDGEPTVEEMEAVKWDDSTD